MPSNKKVVRQCFACAPVGKLKNNELVINEPCREHNNKRVFENVNGFLVDDRFTEMFKNIIQPPVIYGRTI